MIIYFSDRMAEIIKEELNTDEFEIKEEIVSMDTCTEETEIKGKLIINESFTFSFKILNILHEYMEEGGVGLSIFLEKREFPPPPL